MQMSEAFTLSKNKKQCKLGYKIYGKNTQTFGCSVKLELILKCNSMTELLINRSWLKKEG